MHVYVNKADFGLVVLLGFFLCGCSFFKNAGRDLVAGAREELGNPETGEVVAGLTESAGDGLERSIPALDSLLRAHTQPLVSELRDELLGAATRDQITQMRDELLGEATRSQLAMLRDELVGEALQGQLARLREELLGEVTRRDVAAFRDELLGEATNTMVRVLIEDLVAGLAQSYKRELRPVLQEDVDALQADVKESAGFLTRNAKTLVWSLVAGLAVLLIIIGFFVLRYMRSRKMLKLVATEIDSIGDNETKKELTNRIKDRALETGLEPHLHKVVEEQRLGRIAA